MPSDIFGLLVEDRSFNQVVAEVIERTKKAEKLMIVTPNVDHFLRWQNSYDFRNLYSQSDYCLIDGMPLVWLSRILGHSACERITGVDISLELISKANELNWPVAIIGGIPSVLSKACENLSSQFPNIDIFLADSPSPTELADRDYLKKLSAKLAQKEIKVVLICLGSPRQEKLVSDLILNGEMVGSFLCVGATVDFIAGVKRRAPKLVRSVGLEWAFRFIQEPKRLFRRYFIDNSRILKYFFIGITKRFLFR